MTDNEKVATFIGWIPKQPCSHREWIDGAQWGRGVIQCSLCWCRNVDYGRCAHLDKAPDMADPRNYMKALEEVITPDNWRTTFEPAIRMTLTLGNRSVHIVNALADLYDAEH